MTARGAWDTLRALGGDLILSDGELRYRAPVGVIPEELRSALHIHRDELRDLVLAEERERRRRHVSRLLDQGSDRMGALGRWSAAEVAAAHDLGEAVDVEARALIAGEAADASRFEAAVSAWEAALRAAKTGKGPEAIRPVPNAPGFGQEVQRSLFPVWTESQAAREVGRR